MSKTTAADALHNAMTALDAIANTGMDARQCMETAQRALDAMSRAASAPHPLQDVHAFLLGEKSLDGAYFDDKPITLSGGYWWREHLRTAIAAGASTVLVPVSDQREHPHETPAPNGCGATHHAYPVEPVQALDQAIEQARRIRYGEGIRRAARLVHNSDAKGSEALAALILDQQNSDLPVQEQPIAWMDFLRHGCFFVDLRSDKSDNLLSSADINRLIAEEFGGDVVGASKAQNVVFAINRLCAPGAADTTPVARAIEDEALASVPDTVAMECLREVAKGIDSVHHQTQEAHCIFCNANIDDHEAHGDECLTLRARAVIADLA